MGFSFSHYCCTRSNLGESPRQSRGRGAYLISLILRDEDLKTRAAEEAFDRIHEQVGDMSQATEEAEDMFVPLED